MKNNNQIERKITMKTLLIKALLMLGLISQVACEKPKGVDSLETMKTQVNINSSMSADDLVEAGEQLVTPTQFMTADMIFDMALEKDPTNFKAQFYKKLLGSFMVNKGILTRVKPLVRKYGNISEYEKNVGTLVDMPATRFLVQGKEDMHSVKDIQDYLSSYQIAINDFRKFLILNQDRNLTMEISSSQIENLFKQGADAYECTQVGGSKDNLQFECDFKNLAKRNLSTPDFMAIRQVLAGYVLFFNFYTAYSFEGIEVLNSLNIKEGTPQNQLLAVINEKLPNLGKLRTQNLLKETLNIGSDLVSAGRWAITYQNKLCPKGIEKAHQRKGHVFHQGICIKNADETLRSLAVLEQVLSSTVKVKIVENQPEYELDYLAWFKNPVQDLLTLAPKTYNRCGQATSLRDNTMGGLFVNGDADKTLVVSEICDSTKTIN
jgi:hypothetical protein